MMATTRLAAIAVAGVLLAANAAAQQAPTGVKTAAAAPAKPAQTAEVLRAGEGSFADAMRKSAALNPSAQTWVLKAGLPIHVQLAEWAKQSGWDFSWKVDKGYVPPQDATFGGSFDVALEEVVRGLFAEGAPIHLKLWEGNKVAEVVRSTPQ